MFTLFKLIPKSKKLDLDIDAANRSLHPSMRLEKRTDGAYAIVETLKEEDEGALQLVQRELDRIFFLTCARVKAEMCRRRVQVDLVLSYDIHGALPTGLQPQEWNPTIELQLRLWSVAVDIVDPPTKLLIFFQIIELAHQDATDYPKYTNSSQSPHPLTEAKLLRHLVTHAGVATGKETTLYLEFLGLGPVMADRSNPNWLRIVAGKVEHVRAVAYAAIKFALNVAD